MENGPGRNDARLGALLAESGLRAKRAGDAAYEIHCPAELREWVVSVRLTEAWITMQAFVMGLPDDQARRTSLLTAAMSANGRLSLVKFSLLDESSLCLELEYRQVHVDAEVLKNLAHLVVQVGEAEYPRLLRLATCSGALDALEAAYLRTPTED